MLVIFKKGFPQPIGDITLTFLKYYLPQLTIDKMNVQIIGIAIDFGISNYNYLLQSYNTPKHSQESFGADRTTRQTIPRNSLSERMDCAMER